MTHGKSLCMKKTVLIECFIIGNHQHRKLFKFNCGTAVLDGLLSMAVIVRDCYENALGIWSKIIQGFSAVESEARAVCLAFDLTKAI